MSYVSYLQRAVKQMPIVSGMASLGQTKEIVTLQIGGQIRTFPPSEILGIDDLPLIKQVYTLYNKTGRALETWRLNLMKLQKLWREEIPRFLKSDLRKKWYEIHPDEIRKILADVNTIGDSYERAINQFAIARKEYDQFLPYMRQTRDTLRAAGMAGIGNLGIVFTGTALIVLACITVASTGVAVSSYYSYKATAEAEKTKQLMAEAQILAQKGVAEAQAVVKKAIDDLVSLSPELKKIALETGNYTTITSKAMDALLRLGVSREVISKETTKTAEEIAKIPPPTMPTDPLTRFVNILPILAIGVGGIMLAPTIVDIVKSALKKKG